MSLHIFPKPNSSFTEEFKKLLTLLLCPCCVSVTQLPVQKRWQLWETWRENFRHVESNKGLQKPNMLSFACVSECVRVYACVFVSKWARRGEKLNSLCLSFFFRFWECTKKTLHNIFTSNFYSLHTLYRWNSLLQLHEGVFVFPVASCQLLLDLASVTVLSGRRGNNATARPTWAHCVPE